MRFEVATTPPGATVTVTGADGVTRTGRAPFTIEVPTGETGVVIALDGRVTRSERLRLAGPTRITRWLDPTGQILETRYQIRTGSNPKQVAFTPDGSQLWVPLLGSRGVEVFDAASGNRLGLVTLGSSGGGVEVVFDRAGRRAFVSQMETASVYEIDVASRQVLRRFSTGGNWTKVLALSPDETTLWAANWVSDDVSEIDLATGRLRRRIPTVRTPRGLAMDPSGGALWVAGFENGELARIDLASGTQRIVLRTGGAMRHLVVDAAARRLYADDMGTDRAFRVDLADPVPAAEPLPREPVPTATVLAATDSHPNTIDLSPDGRLLFVSNRGRNNPKGYNVPGPDWGTVLVLDTTTGRRLDAVVAGNQTTGLDVSPDGRLLAYTDFLDNRLVVMAVPPTATFTAGSGGRSERARIELVKTAPARR